MLPNFPEIKSEIRESQGVFLEFRFCNKIYFCAMTWVNSLNCSHANCFFLGNQARVFFLEFKFVSNKLFTNLVPREEERPWERD